MSESRDNLRWEADAAGIVTVTIDVANAPVNIFNEALFADVQAAAAAIEQARPRAVVFRSGKPSGFLAGADVKQIQRLKTEAEVRAILESGQELFARIEKWPWLTVAAIHGPCLGGGLEFALACRYRIARHDAATRLGLPEVQLGLIPGWGGTQRLPRRIGLKQALIMILEGAAWNAAKAYATGLADALIPPQEWETGIARFVEDRLAGRPLPRPRRSLTDRLLDGTWAGRRIVMHQARKRLGPRLVHYPALGAALRAVEAGFRLPEPEGYAAEREEFVRVVFTPAARNLLDVFFWREKARKPSSWVSAEVPVRRFQKVAVIGGGVMGSGIAQLLALQGWPVVVKEVNAELASAARQRIDALLRTAADKGAVTPEEAEAARQRLTVTAEWEPLRGADLAIEAVVEREGVKRTVFAQLAEHLGSEAVLASNTSALSITRLAEAVPRPERVAGLHFFNPVHKMPLVEVVRTPHTEEAAVAALVELARQAGKVPVVVQDSPGFLVNRILFPYLDEAVRLLTEGVPAETIDRAAVRFGMPMGPLELLDQIGIDIAADVSQSFRALAAEPSPTPERLAAMAAAGALGKKTGRGFYEYEGERRRGPSQWGQPSGEPSPLAVEPPEASEFSELQERLIYPMLNEAARSLGEGIVAAAWMVDLAMILGTGFAPFRGGPLRTADALGLPRLVRELEALSRRFGPRYEPAPLLRSLAAEERGFYAVPAPAAPVEART